MQYDSLCWVINVSGKTLYVGGKHSVFLVLWAHIPCLILKFPTIHSIESPIDARARLWKKEGGQVSM